MSEHNRALLMNMRTRQSPFCIHISGENFQSRRKGVFELRRIIEHCDIYAIKFMKFHLIIGFDRSEFLRPFFRYCLSSIASLAM